MLAGVGLPRPLLGQASPPTQGVWLVGTSPAPLFLPSPDPVSGRKPTPLVPPSVRSASSASISFSWGQNPRLLRLFPQ